MLNVFKKFSTALRTDAYTLNINARELYFKNHVKHKQHFKF